MVLRWSTEVTMAQGETAQDRRRGARIECDLWIRVGGVDPEPSLRHGDISASGVCFESNRVIGEQGSVHRLELQTLDQRYEVSTLACLVRVVTKKDLWHQPTTTAVAFEFLDDDEQTRDTINVMVRHVAQMEFGSGDNNQLDCRLGATLEGESGQEGAAVIASMRNSGLVMETAWPIEQGAKVRMAIEAPSGRPARVNGVVSKSHRAEDSACYRVEVALRKPEPEPKPGADIEDALGGLLDEMVIPREKPGVQSGPHLSGDLSRVSLSSLLSLVEWEKMTGTLSLNGLRGEATIFVRDGDAVDVETSSNGETPRDHLKYLLQWTEGEFQLEMKSVHRGDKVGAALRTLVFELMAEIDEEKRAVV